MRAYTARLTSDSGPVEVTMRWTKESSVILIELGEGSVYFGRNEANLVITALEAGEQTTMVEGKDGRRSEGATFTYFDQGDGTLIVEAVGTMMDIDRNGVSRESLLKALKHGVEWVDKVMCIDQAANGSKDTRAAPTVAARWEALQQRRTRTAAALEPTMDLAAMDVQTARDALARPDSVTSLDEDTLMSLGDTLRMMLQLTERAMEDFRRAEREERTAEVVWEIVTATTGWCSEDALIRTDRATESRG